MAHIFTFASCIMHQITKDCAEQDTSLDSSKTIAYYVHVDFFVSTLLYFASFHYLMDRLFYFGKMSISRIRRRKIFSSQNCNIIESSNPIDATNYNLKSLAKLPDMDNMMRYMTTLLSNFDCSSMKAAKELF